MAEVKRLACDLCESENGVAAVTITSRNTGRAQTWEVDLCGSCYSKELGSLQGKGRTPRKRPGRPPARGKETHISEENL